MLTSLRLFEVLGYLLGTALLLYLALLMARRHQRQPGERPLFALVLATAVFHGGNVISAGTRLVAGTRIPSLSVAGELVAFGCLALLPPLLLHTHLSLAMASRGTVFSVTRLVHALLLFSIYAPLVVLPRAIGLMLAAPDAEAIDTLAALERPFIAWIATSLILCALADEYLARRNPVQPTKRLYRAVGTSFLANAALFIVTFLLGARTLPHVGRALVAVSMLSSIAPALVFAYFIYRYNYLGLIVRRGVVVGLSIWLALLVYMFGLREVSGRLQALYGIDPRLVDAILILTLGVLVLPFTDAIRGWIFRAVFPELARQQALARELGARLGTFGDRRTIAAQIEAALRSTFEFDRAEVALAGDAGPLLERAAGQPQQVLVRDEVADPQLARVMDERGLTCVVTLAGGLIGVGRSPRWPITSAPDAAPLVALATRLEEALDRAARVETNVALERQLQRQSHLASLGRMAATVAHEVKNPLGAIKAIVQVMREQEGDRDRQYDLQMIATEIDRLAATVNQLLDFSRLAPPTTMDDGAPSPGLRTDAPRHAGPSATDPLQAFRHVVALFGPDATARGIALSATEATVSAVAMSDADLAQVLSNLVLNAMQSGASRVALVAAPMTGTGRPWVRIAVEDNGPGVPDDLASRIFEPFVTTRQRGTGLGLAIVRQRVEAAGGRLTLERPPDGGARFAIELAAAGSPHV